MDKSFFEEIIDDETIKDPKTVTSMVCCSGKIFYDLAKAKADNEGAANIPVLRFEQLYPFPYELMKKLLRRYPKVKEITWVQEEPQNMGSWSFVRGRLLEVLKPTQQLYYCGRKGSGTPAEGSSKAHILEQERIVQDALGLACAWKPDR